MCAVDPCGLLISKFYHTPKEKIQQSKEAAMPIKVLIKRRSKDGYVNEINKVIKEIRFGAMDQEGYITAETM